jgi:hypothetical protein
MKEESLLRKTVVLTAQLLGAFALWTVLLSLVVVGVTGRAVGAMSGGTKSETVEVDAHGGDKAAADRSTTTNRNASRPNG